jgi:hypothetical protein
MRTAGVAQGKAGATEKGTAVSALDLCAKNTKPQQSVEQTRAQFPQCAVWIDDLRKHFGEVRVRYVKEGRRERGKREWP